MASVTRLDFSRSPINSPNNYSISFEGINHYPSLNLPANLDKAVNENATPSPQNQTLAAA
jgi:hypothetical protein